MNSTKIEENVTGETITHEHVRGVPRLPSQDRRRRVSLEDVIRISLFCCRISSLSLSLTNHSSEKKNDNDHRQHELRASHPCVPELCRAEHGIEGEREILSLSSQSCLRGASH